MTYPIRIARPGWVGVDLDGTLAHYDHWRGETHIGEPIWPMVWRVKAMLAQGTDVRIFTARVAVGVNKDGTPRDVSGFMAALDAWCVTHIGRILPVTNVKDFQMVVLYDDRAVQVVHNTGRVVRDPLAVPPPPSIDLSTHTRGLAKQIAAALIDMSSGGEHITADRAVGMRATLRHVAHWLNSVGQKELGDHLWRIREAIPAEGYDPRQLDDASKHACSMPQASGDAPRAGPHA